MAEVHLKTGSLDWGMYFEPDFALSAKITTASTLKYSVT